MIARETRWLQRSPVELFWHLPPSSSSPSSGFVPFGLVFSFLALPDWSVMISDHWALTCELKLMIWVSWLRWKKRKINESEGNEKEERSTTSLLCLSASASLFLSSSSSCVVRVVIFINSVTTTTFIIIYWNHHVFFTLLITILCTWILRFWFLLLSSSIRWFSMCFAWDWNLAGSWSSTQALIVIVRKTMSLYRQPERFN